MCGFSGKVDRRRGSDERDVGKGLEEEVAAMQTSYSLHPTARNACAPHPSPHLRMDSTVTSSRTFKEDSSNLLVLAV